jgi:hypothetical protein
MTRTYTVGFFTFDTRAARTTYVRKLAAIRRAADKRAAREAREARAARA